MNSNSDPSKSLNITGSEQPHVPVFTCTVYVAKNADGTVQARVANLEGIERTEATEREALASVCREFKSRIREAMENGVDMIWTDLSPKRENENVRSIPVHL